MKFDKIIKYFSTFFAFLLSIFSLCGCWLLEYSDSNLKNIADKVETEEKYVDFSTELSDNFSSANWSNGGMFGCKFRPQNITIDNEEKALALTIEKEEDRYYSGEYRTNEFFGYGYYSVCMKPVKNSGVVSSFFTYTGPSDRNPHDEVDIEFVGYDTTIVQFNYFVSGVGGHEYLYDLGYDASTEYHIYGFEWKQNEIIWFVDGIAVYRVEGEMPVTKQKIMINLWNNTNDWAGEFEELNEPKSAYYKWINYQQVD